MKHIWLTLLFTTLLCSSSNVPADGISEALRQKAIALIIEDPHFYTQMREDLQKDHEVVMVAVQQKYFITKQYLHDAFKKDRDVAMVAVASSPYALEFFDESIKDDKEIVFLSVSQNGYSMQFASARLRADREVVYTSVSNYGDALGFVDPSFSLDAKTAHKALAKIDYVTEFMTGIIKRYLGDDGDFVFEAGNAKFANKSLFDDRAYLLRWLRAGKTLELEMVYKRFLNDREVLEALLQSNPMIYLELDETLKKDRALALIALREKPWLFDKLAAVFRKDRAFVLIAVQDRGAYLKDADSKFYDDREIVSIALRSDPAMLGVASKDLRDDMSMVKMALSEDIRTIRFASRRIRSDFKIMRQLVKQKEMLWMYGSDALKKEVRFLALKPQSETFKILTQVETREVASEAWNAFTIDDALDVLYGKDNIYEYSPLVEIYGPLLVTNGARLPITVSISTKTESIAVFQDNAGKKSMVAYIETPESPTTGSYTLTLSSVANVTVVVKSRDGHYYKGRKTTYIRYSGCFDDDFDDSITKERYLQLDNTFRRAKARSNKQGSSSVKFMLKSPMLSYIKAHDFGVSSKYISSVEVKQGKKELLKAYLSQYFSYKPLFKLSWDGNYSEQSIDVVLTDIEGSVISERFNIK